MGVVISEEILQTAHITAEELKQEIGVLLFQQEGLSLAQASRFSGMS